MHLAGQLPKRQYAQAGDLHRFRFHSCRLGRASCPWSRRWTYRFPAVQQTTIAAYAPLDSSAVSIEALPQERCLLTFRLVPGGHVHQARFLLAPSYPE